MNRREAMIAGAAALVGGPVLASTASKKAPQPDGTPGFRNGLVFYREPWPDDPERPLCVVKEWGWNDKDEWAEFPKQFYAHDPGKLVGFAGLLPPQNGIPVCCKWHKGEWVVLTAGIPNVPVGPWDYDICHMRYVAILDEFTQAATGLTLKGMADVQLYAFIPFESKNPSWLGVIPLETHRNSLVLQNGWLVKRHAGGQSDRI